MKKILFVIVGLLLISISFSAYQGYKIYKNQKEWDDYATRFCDQWKQYSYDEIQLRPEEKKPLFVFATMYDKVVSENWESSYLECCRVLNMTCLTPTVENQNKTVILVKVNENDWRAVDFRTDYHDAIKDFLYTRYYRTDDLNYTWQKIYR